MRLQDIDPPIWRRIQVWDDTTLGGLHRTLQTVMGRETYHLHEFLIGRRIYNVPDPDDAMDERKVIDERRKRLRDVVSRVGTRLVYVYDFGDDWRHDLQLEAILLPDPDQQYDFAIIFCNHRRDEAVVGADNGANPNGVRQQTRARPSLSFDKSRQHLAAKAEGRIGCRAPATI